MFELHPQLAKDCCVIGDFSLCCALLIRDEQYPWLILVPKRQNITEIFQLSSSDQQQLMVESSAISELLMTHFKADKINVAALGNMVPQLHVHHIARFKADIAWPNPVWGYAPAKYYTEQALGDVLAALRLALAQLSIEFVSAE